jgi:hypothetical protein
MIANKRVPSYCPRRSTEQSFRRTASKRGHHFQHLAVTATGMRGGAATTTTTGRRQARHLKRRAGGRSGRGGPGGPRRGQRRSGGHWGAGDGEGEGERRAQASAAAAAPLSIPLPSPTTRGGRRRLSCPFSAWGKGSLAWRAASSSVFSRRLLAAAGAGGRGSLPDRPLLPVR